MAKPSTTAKHKYNCSTYRRYEFSVGLDTKLNYILERYTQKPDRSLSALVKSLLAQYFGVDPNEIYPLYHFKMVNGEWVQVQNTELDPLFESFSL